MEDTVMRNRLNPWELFESLVKKQKVGHAYLLEGPSGTGKKALARWTAQALLCLEPKEDNKPCGECVNCRRIQENHHPDVVEITPDGQSIKVGQIRYLKSEFSKSGMESSRKIFIVEEAEKMTPGAANSLLKFLEEPDGKVTAFLLTTAKNRLLPTILSRCQVITFHASSAEKRQQSLIEQGVPFSRAALLVHLTNDNHKALEWNEDEWYQQVLPLIWRWYSLLEKGDAQAFVFVQTDLMPLLKEKQYQYTFLDILLLLYRELLSYHYHGNAEVVFSEQAEELKENSKNYSGTRLADILSMVLDAKQKVERNVAIQGVLEDFALKLIQP